METGNRIPVRYVLIVTDPANKTECWSQTLRVFAVPYEHTKIQIDLYVFLFKEHNQNLRKAKVQELEYPIDEVIYRIDPNTFHHPYRLDDLREKLRDLGWTLEPWTLS